MTMKQLLIAFLLTLSLGANAQRYSGNPILMSFHADPEVMYSHQTGRYYIYSTTDGTPGWGGWYFTCFSSADLSLFRIQEFGERPGLHFPFRACGKNHPC